MKPSEIKAIVRECIDEIKNPEYTKKAEFKQYIKEQLLESIEEEGLEEIFGLGAASEKDFLKAVEKTTNKELAQKKLAEYNDFKAKAEAGDEIAKKIIANINKHAKRNEDLRYKVDTATGEVGQTAGYGQFGPGGASRGN